MGFNGAVVEQNAAQRLAFCPDFLLWLAFCPSQFLVGILSGTSQHVLAFCQNHEKCRHLSECEWGFVWSEDFLPYRQKANSAKSQSQMTLVGHSYEAHFHNSKCSEDDIRWSQRFSYVLRRFYYILSVLRLFSQKKHLKVPEFCKSDVGYLWLIFKSVRLWTGLKNHNQNWVLWDHIFPYTWLG